MKQQRYSYMRISFVVINISQALAVTEVTFKNSKDQLVQEKKNLSSLQRSLAEVRISSHVYIRRGAKYI